MASYLCISISFLQPYSHGRNEAGDPEWPPSPLRLLQALVAASSGRWNERTLLESPTPAFRWLEALPPPQILTPDAVASENPCQLYVPDNTTELVVSAWKKGDLTKVPKRTEKVVCPTHLAGETVHYVYSLPDSECPHLDTLKAAAHSVTHLGWGIDTVVGDASIMSADKVAQLAGHRWNPGSQGTPLRSPKSGTMNDLIRKHADFLNRIGDDGFCPVPPLRVFDVVSYRRDDQPLNRPYRVFELRQADGSWLRYPHRRLIHIAGMLRHLAIKIMADKGNWPRGGNDDWAETYIAGHCRDDSATNREQGDDHCNAANPPNASLDDRQHRQLSYLPLPSVGHEHADPGVRRVMIAAPIGDDAILEHIARRLAWQKLEPEYGNEFLGGESPVLVPVHRDNIARFYTSPANTWHSFTPVILPGHDDHKPEKTRALIAKALAQSGIEQPCEFEWSAISHFRKAYSAHKYDRDKRPQGYIRPKYLLSQTAVHLTLRFKDGLRVPGPITIGAGRHCGLGLMVGES